MNDYRGKTLCTVVTALLLVAVSAPVIASEVPDNTPPDNVREAMKERREDYQEAQGRSASNPSFRERVVERRAQFESGVKDRLKNLLSNVTGRLTALVERFEHIVARMEERSAILEARGADTTAVHEALSRATSEIELAKSLIATTHESEIDQTVDDARPQDRFVALRERIVSTHGHLRSAHAALKDAVALLRVADGAPIAAPTAVEEAATTTATSSPTL